jgi:hypothetical protein
MLSPGFMFALVLLFTSYSYASHKNAQIIGAYYSRPNDQYLHRASQLDMFRRFGYNTYYHCKTTMNGLTLKWAKS